MIVKIILVLNAVSSVVFSIDPCKDAIDIKSPKRSSMHENLFGDIEKCDDDIDQNKWYSLGGNMTTQCVIKNRCGTYLPIWLDGEHPTDDAIAIRQVCSGTSREDCCSWRKNIEIKNCGNYFVYKLHNVDNCPKAYCVDNDPETPSCSPGSVLVGKRHTCKRLPDIEPPRLSKPYITHTKKIYDGNYVLKATMFSVDCFPNLSKQTIETETNLRMEITFKMNDEVIANYNIDNLRIDKITINETLFIGHLDKTLTCSSRFYYVIEGKSTAMSDWFISNEFYFGILITDKDGNAAKEIKAIQGKVYDFILTPTFPITHGHCFTQTDCNLDDYVITMETNTNKIHTSKCKIIFSRTTTEISLKVQVRTTLGVESSSSQIVFHKYKDTTYKSIFHGFTLHPIKIIISDNSLGPTCTSIGDPHFVSFGGNRFDNYEIGDFNLLSANGRRFEIQVRQVQCGAASCNCGVIAREGNSIVGVSNCDGKGGFMIFNTMRDNVNPHPVIKKDVSSYIFHFVSGIIMRADMVGGWLYIYIYGLKTDSYSGVCAGNSGNFNSHRIAPGQSFFKNVSPSCKVEILDFPSCSCCQGSNVQFDVNPKVCDLKPHVVNNEVCDSCVTSEDVDIAFEESHDDDETGFTMDDIAGNIDYEDKRTEVEVKLITESEATDICEKSLSSTIYFEKCKEFIANELKTLMEDCVADVQMSGDENFAKSQVTVLQRICKDAIGKLINNTDVENSDRNKILIELSNNIEAAICPLCFNGVCKDGKCQCLPGYGGDDCFHNLNADPTIEGSTSLSQCDYSKRLCNIINFYYRDIVVTSQDSIESLFQFYSQDGSLINSSTGKATITNSRFLQITLDKNQFNSIIANKPIIKTKYQVIFKRGEAIVKTNSLTSVVFDGVCMACIAGDCLRKNNSCLIDNRCYKSMHSFDGNLQCNPDGSTNSWTRKDGGNKYFPWIILLVCVVVVVAIVIIVVVVIKKRKKRQCR